MMTLKNYLNTFKEGDKVINHKVEQYCSEVIEEVKELIKEDGAKLVVADPGMGKSVMVTNIAKDTKVVFLTPNIPIATQMADEYFKATGKYATLLCSKQDGYICNTNQHSNLVISVYDSITKTEGLGIDVLNHKIFLDEVHQTVMASTYRQTAIDNMERIIGSNYTTLTATPYSLNSDTFTKIMNIESNNPVKRKVKLYKKSKNITTNEYISHIVKSIKGKAIILCNNGNNAKNIQEIIGDLGKSSIVVDANTNRKVRDSIVKTKKFPEGVDIIITTEALSDGVSLYDTDITDMILMKQNINLNHLIQFPARARKSNPIVHYILAESRGNAEKNNKEVNFDINKDTEVSRIRMKKDMCNIVMSGKELCDLFKHNRKFNKYIMNTDKYTINENLLSVDFYTREDKMVNKVIEDLFEYYGYSIEYINSIKKDKNEDKNKEVSKVKRYKDISTNDKVSLVMTELTGNLYATMDSDLTTTDYKKNITSTINKVKTILNIDNIDPMVAPLFINTIELAVDLPDNFNKMAGIKRALDSLENIDLAFCTLVKEIREKGFYKDKFKDKTYTFVREGKYVSKEEQEVIEREFLWLYNNSVKGKFDYDTFMKCVYKVKLSDCRNYTNVIGVLGKSELYLQDRTIILN